MNFSGPTTTTTTNNATNVDSWRSYIIVVFATIIALLGAYIGSLVVLKRTGHLPPPAIVNEVCADEKLMWLREHLPRQPDLLIVGSSIAWRDIDSQQLVENHAAVNPLNGGLCHLEINQANFATSFYLKHIPSIRTVTSVVVPQDFTDCQKATDQLFNPATASAYVFNKRWAYSFYITQFDPVSLVRNAIYVRGMRDGENQFDSLQMTKYGDGPLYTHGYMGLMYGKVAGFDPACFTALHDMAVNIAAGGRRLFVATAPVNPLWEARNDPAGQQRAELADGIRSALAGTGAVFWNGNRAVPMQRSDFIDAIHLNWSAARRFTAKLAKQIAAGQVVADRNKG